MKTRTASSTGPTLMPNLRVEDGLAAYWLQQVHLRLRRELAWLWHGQGLLPETAPGAGLPKFTDPIPAILDQEKFWEEKQQFFRHDPAAQYLTEALAAKPPEVKAARAGSLAWVISCLNLNALESFTLALGLTAAVDSTAGPVLAACLNNPNHTLPSLALVQRLWDEPEAVLSLADPAHPLYCSGLLQYQGQAVEGTR